MKKILILFSLLFLGSCASTTYTSHGYYDDDYYYNYPNYHYEYRYYHEPYNWLYYYYNPISPIPHYNPKPFYEYPNNNHRPPVKEQPKEEHRPSNSTENGSHRR